MKQNTSSKKTKYSHAFFERGSWYHRIKKLSEDGITTYSKKGGYKTPEEAEVGYEKYDTLYKEQVTKYYAPQLNRDMYFKDYLKYWFEEIYSERIETTTKMVGAYAIYDLIIPNVEVDLKLNQITTLYLDDIIEKCSKVTESGGETSRLFIYMSLKDAFLSNYINFNPAKDTKSYPRPKPKVTVLSKKELKKFLKAAQHTNWYLEILLGLFCGLRKGEILALKLKDFNIDKHTLTISRQLVNNPILEKGTKKVIRNERIERPPKTENSFRTIKVPKVIMCELDKRLKLIESNKAKYKDKYIQKDYISCTETGDSHALSSLNQCIDKICSRNSIPHITVHSLRHMFATILIENGATLVEIKGLLGHSSIHTTFEIYCSVMDEREHILAYMNDIFSVEEELS